MTDQALTNQPMLLLTEGGPTYRIEKRLGLIRENSPCIMRRTFLSILLTWVPLLALSALQGTAVGHHVAMPFLRDFAVHARFILSVPLLIFAEVILGPHLGHASVHFIHSGLVLEEDFKRFDSAVEQGLRWRDSTVAELLLALLAYILAITSLKSMAVQASTWHVAHSGSTVSLTWAGWWFVLFCVPLFQFLTLRWLWRLFLWGQFLWRMSKLNLNLIPTHPDEAAGLAFVGEAHRYFSMILFAVSIATASVLANDIVYDNISLSHFVPAIAVYVIAAVGILVAPLCVFCPILFQTKRSGLLRYGTLATEYTSSFQKKWIESPRPQDEELLGTGDIQSLADLGNSFSFIEKMGPLPTGHRTLIIFILACLIPMAPLLLTKMPLEEVVKMLVKIMV
jgi:hypothetical protein